MKIVGRTDGGFLCQMTEDEIGIVAGFGRYPTYGESKDKFIKATGRRSVQEQIPTNAEIKVIFGFDYIERVRSKLKTVSVAASTLRELADMLDHPIPIVLQPPNAEPAITEEK